MNIEAASHGCVEDRLRQDQPIGCNDRGIEPERGESIAVGKVTEVGGSANRKAERLGTVMDRRSSQQLAALCGTRRLRVDRDDIVLGSDERVEDRHREGGCSHEGEAHRAGLADTVRRRNAVDDAPSQRRGWMHREYPCKIGIHRHVEGGEVVLCRRRSASRIE